MKVELESPKMPMLDHLAYTDVVTEADSDYHILEEAKKGNCYRMLAPYAAGWKKYITGWDIPYVTDPIAGSRAYLSNGNYRGNSTILFGGRVVLGPGRTYFTGICGFVAFLAFYYLEFVAPDYLAAGFEEPESLMAALYERHRIEVPLMLWNERWHLRISAQAFNEPSEYEALAEAVLELRS